MTTLHSRFDTVIVGASGSGLLVAERLARGGQRVLVLERRSEIGQPARTWIITAELGRVLGELPQSVVRHKTSLMEVRAGDAVERVRLDPPDLIIERSVLLPYLAERACAAGAAVWTEHDVQELRPRASGIEVQGVQRATGQPFTVETSNLVGADGAHGSVARWIDAGEQHVFPIVQAVVRLPEDHDPTVTKVWFDRERSRFFYWLIPHSRREGVVGVVAGSSAGAREDLDAFLDSKGYTPVSYQGALIPLHRPFRKLERRLSSGRILLVGDAASHVKVTTVGGVVSGLWGAEAAARALLRDTSYGRELRGLHVELWFHDLVRWALDRFHQKHYVDLIGMLNPALREFLGHTSRDSMATRAWELVRRQPRILGLGLRALLNPYRGTGNAREAPRRQSATTLHTADRTD